MLGLEPVARRAQPSSVLDTNDLKLLTALVVALFLSIPYLKRQYFSKPVHRGGAAHA